MTEAEKTTPAEETNIAEKIYGDGEKETVAEPAITDEKPAEGVEVEAKPDEPVTGAPEKYELKLPEDSKLDESEVQKTADYAKSQGFTQEQAQKHLESRSEAVSAHMTKLVNVFEKESNDWIGKVKTDKEIGGDKFNESMETVKRYIDKYGSPEFKQFVEQVPHRNHPEFVRFFVKAAQDSKIMEDKLIMTGDQGPSKKSAAQALYGPGTEVTNNNKN